MKKIAWLGLVALLLVSPAVAGDKLPEGQQETTISVSGMTCGGCCSKIESAVAKLDGVVKVKADYEKGVAMVTFEESKVTVAQIVETINTKTGFKAKAPEETAS